MIKSNYIVFDCETGGLDSEKNPITQFAAIVLNGKTLKEEDRWETFVKPYDNLIIEQVALNSTMVSMSDINNGLSLKDFVETASSFFENNRAKTKKKEMGRLIPVGHNVTFDLNFMNKAFNLQNKKKLDFFFFPNFIDTLVLSKLTWGINGHEKINLGAACSYSGVKITDAHGAMNDVEANVKLFKFFKNRLRKKGDISNEVVEHAREKNNKFFEFKCSKNK